MKNTNIPIIGMGSTQFWTRSNQESLDTLHAFIHNYGKVCIDTAEMYANGRCESIVGKVLSKENRDNVYLIGKILPSNATPKQFEQSLFQTLQRLNTDYLDLYLLHWREKTDLNFLIQAMEEQVKKGIIKHWGVSNFDCKDMNDLLQIPNGNHCYVNQVLYNLYTRGPEYDLFPLLKKNSILPMSYSSLGSSFTDNSIVTRNHKVLEICQKENITPYALMLAFNMYHGVSSLFSTSTEKHMRDNMQSITFDITPYISLLDELFPAPTHATPLMKI